MTMPAGNHWFCLNHQEVEDGTKCAPADCLGPYASAAEAEGALDKVRQRNEEWDNDPNWNDEGPGSGPKFT